MTLLVKIQELVQAIEGNAASGRSVDRAALDTLTQQICSISWPTPQERCAAQSLVVRLDRLMAPPQVLPLRPGVLVADDDQSLRNLLKEVLLKAGFSVWVAAD